MKIIYCYAGDKIYKKFFKKCRELGYEVLPIDMSEETGICRATALDELTRIHNTNKKLVDHYNKIRELSADYDILIVDNYCVYTPDFIKTLKKDIYTVIYSGDDPESSNKCSRPYVHAFDHAFSYGVYFDNESKVTDKFKEWGAKRVNWWPYGVTEDRYDHSLTEDDIYNKNRDIDLAYVGVAWTKLGRLAKIKKAFPQMRLYGRDWNLKTILKSPLSHLKMYHRLSPEIFSGVLDALLLRLWNVKEIPTEGLVPLYQRCKIGINMHLSFGPSNSRLYELPANGVMQICDCSKGLGDVFEIDKEVVAYNSTEEAIEIIKYYLEHDDERKRIAAAGFKRTMEDYKRIIIFSKALEEIKKSMLEEGITHFKDGTPIKGD